MNNNYRNQALTLFNLSDCSFAYVGENGTVSSHIPGVRQLMELARDGFDLSGGFVADRVVGKAAALLMVGMGARRVYAETLSRPAYEIFEKHGVDVLYRSLVAVIINRAGDDICPMEKTVLGTDDPHTAYTLLAEKIKQMKTS